MINHQDLNESTTNEESVTFEDIKNAYKNISQYVHETPVLTCSSLNDIASKNCSQSIQLYFKCENFQKTGSFKVRF